MGQRDIGAGRISDPTIAEFYFSCHATDNSCPKPGQHRAEARSAPDHRRHAERSAEPWERVVDAAGPSDGEPCLRSREGTVRARRRVRPDKSFTLSGSEAPEGRRNEPSRSHAGRDRTTGGCEAASVPADGLPRGHHRSPVLGSRCPGLGRLDFLERSISVRETITRDAQGSPVFGPPKLTASRRTVALPATVVDLLIEHVREQHLDLDDTDALVFTAPRRWPTPLLELAEPGLGAGL